MQRLTAVLFTVAFAIASSQATEEEKHRWVKVHNIYRCMAGMGMVGWNDAAAANAQTYVNSLTSLVHSQSYGLAPPAGPAGENLASGYYTLEEAVAGWYEEVNACVSFPGCTSGTGGAMVGHFTAVVWKGVTEIGCAVNAMKIYICRYTSGDVVGAWTANMMGAYELNVPHRPTKTRAECEGATGSLTYSGPSPSELVPTPPPATQPGMSPQMMARSGGGGPSFFGGLIRLLMLIGLVVGGCYLWKIYGRSYGLPDLPFDLPNASGVQRGAQELAGQAQQMAPEMRQQQQQQPPPAPPPPPPPKQGFFHRMFGGHGNQYSHVRS